MKQQECIISALIFLSLSFSLYHIRLFLKCLKLSLIISSKLIFLCFSVSEVKGGVLSSFVTPLYSFHQSISCSLLPQKQAANSRVQTAGCWGGQTTSSHRENNTSDSSHLAASPVCGCGQLCGSDPVLFLSLLGATRLLFHHGAGSCVQSKQQLTFSRTLMESWFDCSEHHLVH